MSLKKTSFRSFSVSCTILSSYYPACRALPRSLTNLTMSKLNNIYKEDTDFATLALQDADFAKV